MLTDYQKQCVKELENYIDESAKVQELLITEKMKLHKDIEKLRKENLKLQKELDKYAKFENHPKCKTCSNREKERNGLCEQDEKFCLELYCNMKDNEYCCLHSELK